MKISVALCTYNGDKYITEQLKSILNQTTIPNHIIICDDGSIDDTLKIIKDFQRIYPFIELYQNINSLGVVKNFEKAINLCKNGIVLLCDQDDIWFEDKVEVIVNYFKEHSVIKAVFHNLELYNGQPSSFTIWDYLSFGETEQLYNNNELLIYTAVIDNVMTGAATAFIKDSNFNFTNEIPFMLHDYYILLHFANKNQLGVLNKNLGYYRIHQGQQVGAQLEANKYLMTLKDQYFDINLKVKLELLFKSLQKYILYKDKTDVLNHSIDLLNQELICTKKEYFKSYNYITKILIVINWYRNKKYYVKLKEVFNI